MILDLPRIELQSLGSPLMEVADRCSLELACFLIGEGADPTIASWPLVTSRADSSATATSAGSGRTSGSSVAASSSPFDSSSFFASGGAAIG